LPRANESLALTDRGYRIGRFPYRELALAKNLIVDLELRRLDAAARFHRARIEIERLTGAQLTLIAE
jgi:cobalt-zinc-cadmium efflux system outer membrane protein